MAPSGVARLSVAGGRVVAVVAVVGVPGFETAALVVELARPLRDPARLVLVAPAPEASGVAELGVEVDALPLGGRAGVVAYGAAVVGGLTDRDVLPGGGIWQQCGDAEAGHQRDREGPQDPTSRSDARHRRNLSISVSYDMGRPAQIDRAVQVRPG